MKRVLGLNPFHGGSHKAFINGWISRSQHEWALLTLEGTYWKWRLQFAAVELSEQVKKLWDEGKRWDVIFCTSMMNVTDFRAMTPEVRDIPIIVYFHENQLTYPESDHMKFDLSLCMINIKSALVADQVWFNSEFHRDDFLTAAEKLLKPKPLIDIDVTKKIRQKTIVQYQAIDDDFVCKEERPLSDPIKIVWAARWELDKNPELLFKALKYLVDRDFSFELYFLGEEMHTKLECIEKGRCEFTNQIKYFGYAESRQEYMDILKQADFFVSTANHEFFGIAVVEALAAGCIPIVPKHQAYPEVLKSLEEYFYRPGSAKQLAKVLIASASDKSFNSKLATKYLWSKRAKDLDKVIAMLK
ncbi:MAG: DUF3524 domain-containing protein [Lentisphaeraceae bacterium]|nr:DUF3524 domain-containing protein [Lentisphaeraceae bacterium]